MGIPVLILGESGSGKSASLRNFEPEDISVFNIAQKPFPFRKKLPKVDTDNYTVIKAGLSKSQKKSFAIDDSQYLMAFESFRRARETGYGKFTDMAVNFKDIIEYVIKSLPPDTIVYFLHHTQTGEDGKYRAKTIGKMLDSQLTVEGLFSIVLLCVADDDGHHFITQGNGTSTAKSPMDMFNELVIDNDLKAVDEAIRKYYFTEE